MNAPRKDLDPDELLELVTRLIFEEQGKPVGLMVAKNLPMLPTETAWRITNYVAEKRSTLFVTADGETDQARVAAFSEGILCGLRIRAAISTLELRRDG